MKRMTLMLIGLVTLCLIMAPLVGCAPEGVSQYKYDALQAEYDALQEVNDALNEKLDEAKARVELINYFLIPAFTGELYEMTDEETMLWFLEWQGDIMAIGDPTLDELFQECMEIDATEEEIANLFIYILESAVEALE